jgi:16S rRNA (uracil1498-N3)-methyltransferase
VAPVRAPRFYLDQALAVSTRVELPAPVAHHAHTVLRLRHGDPIVLFNGRGGEFAARLAGTLQADVIGFDPIEREAGLRITLIQALAASEKIDWIIEKAVEIGVARVIVTAALRSAVRLDPVRTPRRLQRWSELAIAACCQCGRNRLVPIEATASLDQALRAAGNAQHKWVLDPAAPHALAPAHAQAPDVALAIGPEGGFDPAELASAEQAGFVRIALGPRILRTETAGLVAAAAWLALNGEFSAHSADQGSSIR